MPDREIAFLGPEGTFAHLAVQKRFGNKNLIPKLTVKDVFEFVSADPVRRGVVPIENSSGGTIYETVDRLVDDAYAELKIQEALSVRVKLALLGRKDQPIHVVFSHFAPLSHCQSWLDVKFPRAERREMPSTAQAVAAASRTPNSAAIAHLEAGLKEHLKVLEYPIEPTIPNVTQFLLLAHKEGPRSSASRTSLVVTLPNQPGTLCDFLEPFKRRNVNLSRIISRPIVGKPNAYIFLVDLSGSPARTSVRQALSEAKTVTETFRSLGSYPVSRTLES